LDDAIRKFRWGRRWSWTGEIIPQTTTSEEYESRGGNNATYHLDWGITGIEIVGVARIIPDIDLCAFGRFYGDYSILHVCFSFFVFVLYFYATLAAILALYIVNSGNRYCVELGFLEYHKQPKCQYSSTQGASEHQPYQPKARRAFASTC
jgi:hypothetical protein